MAVYGSMENWQEQINRNNVGHWRTTPGRGRRVTPLQRNSDFDDELEGVRPADTEEEAPPQMAQRAAPAAAQAGGKPGMPPNPAAAQATAPTATLAQPSADLRRIAALPPEQRTPQEHYALQQRRTLEERNVGAGAGIKNPMLGEMRAADEARKNVALEVAYEDADKAALQKAGRPARNAAATTNPTNPTETPAMTAPARATIPTDTPPSQPNAALPGFAARTMPDGTVRAVSGNGKDQTFRSFADQSQAQAFYRPGAQQPGGMLANAIAPPAPAAAPIAAPAPAMAATTAPVQPAAPQKAPPAGPIITPAPMSDEEAYRMSQPVAAAQPAVQPHGGPTYGLDWWAKQQGQPSTFRPGPMPPAGTPLIRPQSTAVSALSGGSRFTAPSTRLAMQNAQFKSTMPTQPAGPIITPAPMSDEERAYINRPVTAAAAEPAPPIITPAPMPPPELTITPAPMTDEEKARMRQPVATAQSTMPIRKPAPVQAMAGFGRQKRGHGGYQSEY